MAHLVRPLAQLTRLHRLCCSPPTLYNLFNSPFLLSPVNVNYRLYITGIPSYHRSVHFRSRGLRLQDASVDSEVNYSDPDFTEKKIQKENRRQACRAVRWAMRLVAFSPTQIKRIIRGASLEPEVFDAIMLVKRFGRVVREHKHNQFHYIGKLIQEVQPDLMDDLIRATKDGDLSKFKNLYGSEIGFTEDDAKEETGSDDEAECPEECINTASRWFDGLINRDMEVGREIYSMRTVEFDRQELSRLVREIFILQEEEVASEEAEGEDKDLLAAKKSLARFLRAIAKQLPSE